jgi:hypothetical protein
MSLIFTPEVQIVQVACPLSEPAKGNPKSCRLHPGSCILDLTSCLLAPDSLLLNSQFAIRNSKSLPYALCSLPPTSHYSTIPSSSPWLCLQPQAKRSSNLQLASKMNVLREWYARSHGKEPYLYIYQYLSAKTPSQTTHNSNYI